MSSCFAETVVKVKVLPPFSLIWRGIITAGLKRLKHFITHAQKLFTLEVQICD